MKTLSYWDKLSSENRPIILYGTGNGADKIIDACNKYNIKISGVFASDGFVRNRTFRDMQVMSHSDVREKFGDDIVVMPAFGTTLPSVMEMFQTLDNLHDLIIPEVPLYGEGIFDSSYLEDNREGLDTVYNMLSDEYSRELFKDAVLFRLTGKLEYLNRCEDVRTTLRRLPVCDKIKYALDGGAFKGDSALDMMCSFPNIEKIIACEPDPKTFKKLSDFSLEDSSKGIIAPANVALGCKTGTSECVSSGSRGSGIEGRNKRAKTVEIQVDTIDNICQHQKIDYLKLDVEGFEMDALDGAVETIKRERPTIAASLYHRTGDIISLPLKIKELLARLDDSVKEVIIATNPSVEGEATAMYLGKLLKPLGIKVTRLAYGLPVGGTLEYADNTTLWKAIEGRTEV